MADETIPKSDEPTLIKVNLSELIPQLVASVQELDRRIMFIFNAIRVPGPLGGQKSLGEVYMDMTQQGISLHQSVHGAAEAAEAQHKLLAKLKD